MAAGARRLGSSEAWRRCYLNLGNLLELLDGFLEAFQDFFVSASQKQMSARSGKSNRSCRREMISHGTILGNSWGHLERSSAVLDPSWSLLGASWELPRRVLGASWRDLEASWGDLGASWGALGASWSGLVGVCWPRLVFVRFWARFGTDLGTQKAPQKGPKWSP